MLVIIKIGKTHL